LAEVGVVRLEDERRLLIVAVADVEVVGEMCYGQRDAPPSSGQRDALSPSRA
jgi:hypothetical protein